MITPRSRLHPARVIGLALLLTACDPAAPPPPPAPQRGVLAEGVAARVGVLEVPVASVVAIAASQRIDPVAARERAIRDALLASEATAQGLDAAPDVRGQIDGAVARALVQDLELASEGAGPVTDGELASVTARHWLDLDRPDGVRTVHAVIRLDPKATDDQKRRALDLAKALRKSLEPVAELARTTPPQPAPAAPGVKDAVVTELKRVATAVPHEGLEIVAEELPPVAGDARVLSPKGGTFDPAFAAAAIQLQRRGDLSPPVHSSFGVHVILLLERIPGHSVPADERRRLVRDEVLKDRSLAAYAALLDAQRAGVAVERNADALLALVTVGR